MDCNHMVCHHLDLLIKMRVISHLSVFHPADPAQGSIHSAISQKFLRKDRVLSDVAVALMLENVGKHRTVS